MEKEKKTEAKTKVLTIRDVAKLAGVSAASVSYVINGKKGVGQEQRKKIEQIISEYHFRPNQNSRGLSLNKSFNIHAVIRREAAPACKDFYFGVLAKMVDLSEYHQYNIVPAYQSDNPADKNIINIIQNKNTDGILFFQGMRKDIKKTVVDKRIPHVIINPGLEENDSPSVLLDFERMTFEAARFLAGKGHIRIGFIGMRCMPFFFKQTIDGFMNAKRQYRFHANKAWISGDAYNGESAAASMRKILHSKTLPTAIVCVQDNFAISAINAVKTEGYRVPHDISFISIDDVPMAKYLDPPLTTIPIDQAELALYTFKILFDFMEGKTVRNITLPVREIIVRDSVRIL
jgi:DNA-binding LacI/PurR family transcriptional regulator